jgi:hypothetical protein
MIQERGRVFFSKKIRNSSSNFFNPYILALYSLQLLSIFEIKKHFISADA